jgi:hypothetical protein
MANGEKTQELIFEELKAKARTHYRGKSLKELVEAMDRGRKQKAELEVALMEVNAFYDVLRYECVPTAMEIAGVQNVTYDGIGRVSLTPDVFVSMKPGAKDALFTWLKKNKLADLIQPTINSSTLKAWVKERMKASKKVPSEHLNVTPVTRASITKV